MHYNLQNTLTHKQYTHSSRYATKHEEGLITIITSRFVIINHKFISSILLVTITRESIKRSFLLCNTRQLTIGYYNSELVCVYCGVGIDIGFRHETTSVGIDKHTFNFIEWYIRLLVSVNYISTEIYMNTDASPKDMQIVINWFCDK